MFKIPTRAFVQLLASVAIAISLFAIDRANGAAANPLPSCPPDWKVELIAEVPRILHPSVVCVIPDGRVLVGQNPMDQTPDPQGRPIDSILCFHPDGRVTTWATNLYAVFGLAYLDGKVFVHQYPKLTVFKDAGDVGTDPELLFNTHPKPIGGLQDHIAANLRFAMDGYFHTAVGIVRGETADELTLFDGEGKPHVIAKKIIASRKLSELSPMPEGLQVGLSLQEFSDLVSYVESLKDRAALTK